MTPGAEDCVGETSTVRDDARMLDVVGTDANFDEDDDRAEAFFPRNVSMEPFSEGDCDDDAVPTADAAWDVDGALDANEALDRSKARNKEEKKNLEDYCRPLLQLGTFPLDDREANLSMEEASTRLLLQKARIDMYNCGAFGVGEDSSDDCEVDAGQNSRSDSDEDLGVEITRYEDMDGIIHNDENDHVNEESLDTFRPDPLGNVGSGADIAALSTSLNRADRWNHNPDAISEVDDESDFFDATVFSNFARSPPPQLPLEPDRDTTSKADPRGGGISDSISSSAISIKIPPPPSDKLRQWEKSKCIERHSMPMPSQYISDKNSNEDSPSHSKSSHESASHRRSGSIDFKIHLSKSPLKKKPQSLIEELDLAGHKRMAKKIVMATSKAATKFEEQYAPITRSAQPHIGSPEAILGELTRGAFSPWKIPDRAEDESSIASSAWMSMVAGTNSTDGKHHELGATGKNQDDNLNESFEVSLGEDREGSLASVLRWLFDEVLPTNSPIATAFSAFDINAETAVQSDRVLAIARDDESFNLICKYVNTTVLKLHCNVRAESENDPHAPRQILTDGYSDDMMILSHKSSTVTTSHILEKESTFTKKTTSRILTGIERGVETFEILPSLEDSNARSCPEKLAANFVDFLQRISHVTGIPSPFAKTNPFRRAVAHDGISSNPDYSRRERKSMQDLIFPNEDRVVAIFQFLWKSCRGSEREIIRDLLSAIEEDQSDVNKNIETFPTPTRASGLTSAFPTSLPYDKQAIGHSTIRRSNKRNHSSQKLSKPKVNVNPNFVVPKESPSPFETAVWNQPGIILSILSFLGNPVSVCVMKRLNVFCNRVVSENQHVLMRDAVRLGGMSKYVRPSFWLWVTEMCKPENPIPSIQSQRGSKPKYNGLDFLRLKDIGSKEKWHHVIERDVTRAFGNMPPHKTGARYKQDSIVRALVSFGKEEIMRNSRSYMDKVPEESRADHFKLSSRLDRRDDSSNGSSGSLTPTDTVSDWGGISPVGSLIGEEPSVSTVNIGEAMRIISYDNGENFDTYTKTTRQNLSLHISKSEVSDPVLSGNALTSEMKVDLQNKLRSILHALAARHEGVGYCQGMDYIVAHLLRVLQDTILLREVQRSLPTGKNPKTKEKEKQEEAEDWRTISSDELRARMNDINYNSVVVEEVVFRVMDTFFSTYNLQHMYWPELRCLKTCCRVFESLIKQKLPVLADHFQHHDLNVGLFALGWFQTLFLYLPSMPSATVCHIWDIWLVERSFKIFFRVGTAILFLSQPTLLNHDLEGMMTYLNTFPDATLLRRDILIPCALQIKITNRMLVEIEIEMAKSNQSQDHNNEYPV
ncbi:hypothetical protein ACHAXA_005465 [Cyclostephanos tholiformis]|uniref:Rab-GAP TBC domain-containing protein n=1 Tax=Cyclostephanos tholiformis TaxID=382380 RepID=A0ABD3SHB8_9STRA